MTEITIQNNIPQATLCPIAEVIPFNLCSPLIDIVESSFLDTTESDITESLSINTEFNEYFEKYSNPEIYGIYKDGRVSADPFIIKKYIFPIYGGFLSPITGERKEIGKLVYKDGMIYIGEIFKCESMFKGIFYLPDRMYIIHNSLKNYILIGKEFIEYTKDDISIVRFISGDILIGKAIEKPRWTWYGNNFQSVFVHNGSLNLNNVTYRILSSMEGKIYHKNGNEYKGFLIVCEYKNGGIIVLFTGKCIKNNIIYDVKNEILINIVKQQKQQCIIC
jgi:hypothetical protein